MLLAVEIIMGIFVVLCLLAPFFPTTSPDDMPEEPGDDADLGFAEEKCGL